MDSNKYTIYTDGGARGNPGPAGAGAVIYDVNNKKIKEASQFLGDRTNNYAEYEAVYLGLTALKKIVPQAARKDILVEVKLDSELVCRQLSHEYKIKEESLFGQFIKVHNLNVKDFPLIMYTHIPREQNKEADALANEAMDRGN